MNKENPNLVEQVGLRLGYDVIDDWARHAPVFYDVPGVLNEPVQLYPARGMSWFKLTLPKPQSLDGKTLAVYGRDPATRQQKKLFEAQLNTKK